MQFGRQMFRCSVRTCGELIDFNVGATCIMMTAELRPESELVMLFL
jgi:hypothetical protein